MNCDLLVVYFPYFFVILSISLNVVTQTKLESVNYNLRRSFLLPNEGNARQLSMLVVQSIITRQNDETIIARSVQ